MDIEALLECPISLELLHDPVTLLESGITYDRESLRESLRRYPDLEPATGQRFGRPLDFVASVTLLRIVGLVRAATEPSEPQHVSARIASAVKALLVCPISHQTMEDPVVVHDSGIVYDRKSLCAAHMRQPEHEPFTSQRDGHAVKFTPCITARNLIRLLHGETQLRIDKDDFRTPPVATRRGAGDPPGAPTRVRGGGGTRQLTSPLAIPAALRPPAAPAIMEPRAVSAAAPAAAAAPAPPAVPAVSAPQAAPTIHRQPAPGAPAPLAAPRPPVAAAVLAAPAPSDIQRQPAAPPPRPPGAPRPHALRAGAAAPLPPGAPAPPAARAVPRPQAAPHQHAAPTDQPPAPLTWIEVVWGVLGLLVLFHLFIVFVAWLLP
jgi:U-box domain